MFITGYSIKSPGADNPKDFYQNLRNGIDMTSEVKRYPVNYKNLPPRAGTLLQINKFDQEFFNLNSKQTEKMDIGIRLLLEVTHEAIMDSKISLDQLNNSKTGVYIGHCFSDYFLGVGFDESINGYELVNGARAMAANKISYFYNLKGPSLVIDTACSSSAVALTQAFNDIKSGIIDRAIVGGISITINPNINNMFNQFTMLSPDGRCYSFDKRANGYCRSEGIGVIIVESERVCRFGYSSILAISTNSDGYKEKGITFPSGEDQAINAWKAFNSANINPESIKYIEAHGTGTIAGDSQELSGFMKVFYSRDQVPKKYKIGSVKSCMGHAEGASGLMSIIKCLIMYEKKKLFPNLNFESSSHFQINDGYFEVVDKYQDWNPGNICISNYGFGGTNSFIILGCGNLNFKELDSHLGLTFGFKHQISSFFDDQIYLGNDKLFNFRNGKPSKSSQKIAFIYGGQGSQWNFMGKYLMENCDIFRQTIDRLATYLPNDSNIDLCKLFLNGSNWLNKEFTTLGICSYQIAVTNILRYNNITPDFYIGHSLGEIAAGYANNLQSERECISMAYIRTLLSSKLRSKSKIIKTKSKLDLELVINFNNFNYYYLDDRSLDQSNVNAYQIFDLDGKMSAVGLPAKTIQEGIDNLGLLETCIACYNSPTGQTISGSKKEVNRLQSYLEQRIPDLFWRDINTEHIAYHAPHLECYFDWLINKFNEILNKQEIELDGKWIPTNTLEKNIKLNSEFHARNIISPVYFQAAIECLPANTLVIEVGPSSSLLSQIKRIRNDIKLLNLVKINDPSSEKIYCDFIQLKNIFWEGGLNIYKGKKVFPEIRLPIEDRFIDVWDHSKDQRILTYKDFEASKSFSKRIIYDLSIDKYLLDHQIRGKSIFPATGHILTMWKHIGIDKNIKISEYEIYKAILIESSNTKIVFEIIEMDNKLAIKYLDDIIAKATIELKDDIIDFKPEFNLDETIPGDQFYNHLKRYGYEYQKEFQLITQKGKNFAKFRPTKYLVSYLDNMLQLFLGVFNNNYEISMLRLPSLIKEVYLDHRILEEIKGETIVRINNYTLSAQTNYARIQSLFTTPAAPAVNPSLIHQKYQFVEYANHYIFNLKNKLNYDLIVNKLRYQVVIYLLDLKEKSQLPINLESILKVAQKKFTFIDQSEIKLLGDINLEDINHSFIDQIINNIPDLIESKNSFSVILNQSSYLKFNDSSFILNFENDYLANLVAIIKQDNTGKNLNVLEIGSGLGGFTEKILPLLEHQLANYNLTDIVNPKVPDNFSKYPIKTMIYNLNEKLDGKYDLITSSHSFYNAIDLVSVLTNLVDNLNDNGFILLQELIDDFNMYIWGLNIHKFYSHWLSFNEWTELINSIPQLEIIVSYYNDYNALILIKKKNNMLYQPISYYTQVDLTKPQIISSHGSFGLVRTLKQEYDNINLKALISDNSISALNSRLKLNFNTIQKYKFGTTVSIPCSDLLYTKLDNSILNYELYIEKPGDLSTLTFLQAKQYNYQVFFSSLNFKDIMYSFGKLKLEKPSFGLEFSGISPKGKPVMGIGLDSCIAKFVDPVLTWEVPEYLSLEEASTIPVVYLTVLYALFEKARLVEGQSILIHSGTGGIGMAAIHICLNRKIKVFTTCSKEKRQYLKEKFNLSEYQISNSRDISFKNDILYFTNGLGVDCVLNSLSGDLLSASLDLVKQYGSFCEIGKYDLENNTSIGIKVFENNISYYAIELSTMFNHPILNIKLKNLLQKSLDSKEIIPLPYTVFNDGEIENALRLVSSGKHRGKVIIDQKNNVNLQKTIKKRFITSGTHIIIGGLGGFGLELAYWLLEHHADKVICTSRSYLKTSWQKYRYSKILSKYPNQIEITNLNVVKLSECEKLLNTPNLKGLYHVAMILKDSLFKNMTSDQWDPVWECKVIGMQNIDICLRKNSFIDKNLQVLVVFSSVSSLFGNIGQSNYAAANNACETIITNRNLDNLKGVSIQWGAIDNVGILGDSKNLNRLGLEIIPQNIDLSLESLDYLIELRGIYSSFLRKEVKVEQLEELSLQGIRSKICQVLGGKEADYQYDRPIMDYGLDSLSTIEIINWINRYLKNKVKSNFITKNITINQLYIYMVKNE